MLKSILCLCLLLHNVSSALLIPGSQTILEMKTGVQLRMHVVAQDDTEEMQQLKLFVRDAVRHAYRENCPDPQGSMLANSQAILPLLAQTAVEAARSQGFEGAVQVVIEQCEFPAYDLGRMTLPAGVYPAFMIRLGSAQGHNWWGLIDPALAFWSASIPQADGASMPTDARDGIVWDWSLRGFLAALLGRPLNSVEGSDV